VGPAAANLARLLMLAWVVVLSLIQQMRARAGRPEASDPGVPRLPRAMGVHRQGAAEAWAEAPADTQRQAEGGDLA
jgi:hypothetical protein